jgi:hypothetical protein
MGKIDSMSYRNSDGGYIIFNSEDCIKERVGETDIFSPAVFSYYFL